MSSLQVTNVFFDESSNNGFLYTGTNSLTVKLGGNNIITLDRDYFNQSILTLSANNSDSQIYYIPMSANTSNAWSSGIVSNTKLYFVPSTGTLNSTIFNSLSDENRKKDIYTVENALNTVGLMRGVEFIWKDNNEKSSGVIGQELEKVLPHLVQTNDDGIKSVNYSGIIAYLIQAIKELEAKIDEKK